MKHRNFKIPDEVSEAIDVLAAMRQLQTGRRITPSDIAREALRLGVLQIRSLAVLRDVLARYDVELDTSGGGLRLLGDPEAVAAAHVELGIDIDGGETMLALLTAHVIDEIAATVTESPALTAQERVTSAMTLPLPRGR